MNDDVKDAPISIKPADRKDKIKLAGFDIK